MPVLYHALFRFGFTRMDPEDAHHLAARAIEIAGAIPPVRGALAATFGRSARSESEITMFGRHLSGRLGAAAGFDKDARMVRGLVALGFSHVEIGTVTAHPQPGNDKPRLFRIIADCALVNRMGFNNVGSAAVAARLRSLRSTRHGRGLVVGVNIGKTKVTPADLAPQDYATSATRLAPFADYLVVNVSSPNTPGLRDLQSVDALRPILIATQQAADSACRRRVPVLVKIAPDLADDDVRAVGELVLELDLAGVVATNTTIAHDHGAGGLSGRPLAGRARDVVRLVRSVIGPEKAIIGVGGVTSAQDADALIDAGADLVQGYTAFIYEGPGWPGRVSRGMRSR